MTQEIIRSVNDIETVAETAFKSGLMNLANSSQAVMKILAGQEMGLGAFTSLSGIHIIQDKPVIGANLMASAVKSSGKYNYRFEDFSKQTCELVFLEKIEGVWQEIGTSRFTMDDAAAAGLLDKKNKDGSENNWKKYPQNMLFARALSNGVRWYCPDVFNGAAVYTPDEFGKAVDNDGNMIEGTWQAPQEPKTLGINDLIQQYGSEAVFSACNGILPDDDPEALQQLQEKLETEYTPV